MRWDDEHDKKVREEDGDDEGVGWRRRGFKKYSHKAIISCNVTS